MSLIDSITLYVALVLFGATLVRSTLGFGEALVAVPLLALRTPISVAAPLAVLVSVVVAGVIVLQDWRRADFRSARGLVLSALPGIPLGLVLLATMDDQAIKIALGSIIIAFSIYSLSPAVRRVAATDHRGWMVVCGFASGILGGAYGMNGPPLAVYGALRRWTPQQFRATLQGYFLPASIVSLIGYAAIGLWDASITQYFLTSLPGIGLAIVLGRAINRRMTGDGFLTAVHAGLLLIGVGIVLQALVT